MNHKIDISAAIAANHASSMVTIMGQEINIYGAIITLFFAVFLIALWRAQKAKRLDWLDMLTRDGTKVSITKILQLVGGVVGTWVVIKLTLQGTVNWDIYAIYLGYVASVDGFSKLIMAKYGAEGSDDSRAPYRRRNDYQYDNYDDRPRKSPERLNDQDDVASRGAAKTPE